MSQLTPFFATNPFFNVAAQSSFGSNLYAANSQDIGRLLLGSSGQRLPIFTFPSFPIFTSTPGLQSFDGGLQSSTGLLNGFGQFGSVLFGQSAGTNATLGNGLVI